MEILITLYFKVMAEEISPDVIKKTQKLLGKHVKKPALTEKLLKKPPFRFLHDIVISVVKETAFLKGLFSPEELLSENVKEKEAKINFLNKLIEAVKSVTQADLSVRASKVVAGLEPSKTNLLLQVIGKAIDDKIDTSEYVNQLKSGKTDLTEKKKSKKPTPIKEDKGKNSRNKTTDDSSNKIIKSRKITESPRTNTKASTPKESSRNKNKGDKKKSDSTKKSNSKEEGKLVENDKNEVAKVATPKEIVIAENTLNKNQSSDFDKPNNVSDVKIQEKEPVVITEIVSNHSNDTVNLNLESQNQDDNLHFESIETKSSSQNLVRPKSAKSKNGDRSVLKHRTTNSDQDGGLKPLQMTASQAPRPKSSLRPPSVRPSSARPGAPRLRPDSALPLQETVVMGNINVIVENVDNMDEEETIIIQTSEMTEENFNTIDMPQDNKGQLVEQILEQIQEDGDAHKTKIEIDWENDALHGKDGIAKEINQLRSLIQILTKTANPLGKLINYLHEDIDAMHGELQRWINIKNQLFGEIYKQKRLSAESNKPLLTQLERLQEEIKKQQQEIVMVRGNILKNDLRIKELLNV